MKKFFLMLSFVTVTIVGSDRTISEFKDGFFGSTGLFEVKKFETNVSSKISDDIQIKENKKVTQTNVVFPNENFGDLNPLDTACNRLFHWGFNPITETTRRNFLEERLQHLKNNKNATCFEPVKEDNFHVSWSIKGEKVGDYPAIVEHFHEGSCANPKYLRSMCNEFIK